MQTQVSARDLAHDSFVKARSNEPVSSLIGRFLKTKQNHALIFDDSDSYVGVTSKEALLKKHVDFSSLKISSIIQNKPVLFADDSLSKIAELMYSTETRVLPVFDKHAFLGVVTAKDVAFQIRNDSSLRNIPVANIASSRIQMVLEDDSIEKTISLFREHKINRVPLVSKTGELAGLFSFSDLLANVALHEHKRPRGKKSSTEDAETTKLLAAPVKMVASHFPVTIRPTDSLETAIRKLSEQNISSLVVIEQNKPVGLLTIRDLLSVLTQKPQSVLRIEFVNKPKLDEVDDAALQKKAQEFYEKLFKRFRTDLLLSVRFKLERSTGIRKKYLVSVHVNAPGLSKMARATDWNHSRAVQLAFKALEREIQKTKK